MLGGGGCAAAATDSAPTFAPLESRISWDMCTSPLRMQRLPVAQPRSFSDSSSYLLLFSLSFLDLSVSNLAIAVAAAVRKSLVALASRNLFDNKST